WIKTIKFKSYIIEDFGAIKGDAKLFDQIANAFKALKKNKEFDYKSTFKIALSGIYNNNSNIQKNSLQLLLKLIKNKKNKKFDNPELSVNFFNIIYFEDTNKQTLLLYFKGVYSSSTKTIRLNKKYENSDSDNSSDESSDNSSETYPSDSSSIEF
ncbi:hypothetical protein L6269_03315, partial [Candidatus Dependentiae bacterium]|nr:hypothetical protein [Candidatus Dependentiae bacterium]